MLIPSGLLARLAVAAGGVLLLLVVGLAVVIKVTSAPELPPPPLPTVTPRPGPSATSIVVHVLPTATAEPAASPNLQLDVQSETNPTDPATQSGLTYEDTAHSHSPAPPCVPTGRWALDVNPLGRVTPHPAAPHASDWTRAAEAIGTAIGICPVPVAVSWYEHNARYPASDHWMALIPTAVATSIDGTALERYARAHSRQV